jgi:hypothetical protein
MKISTNKIPANTIEELPVGTFFRHDSNAGFIVVSSNRAKCIFSKSSLLTKDETYEDCILRRYLYFR